MLLEFPCVVKEVNYLDINDLLVYIKSGCLVEAQMPNGVLSCEDGKYLTFKWDDYSEWISIKWKDNDEIKNWIKDKFPKVTEEDRREKELQEAEYDLRATALSEACSYDVYETDGTYELDYD